MVNEVRFNVDRLCKFLICMIYSYSSSRGMLHTMCKIVFLLICLHLLYDIFSTIFRQVSFLLSALFL